MAPSIRRTSNSQWDDIKGFDRTIGNYITLDCKGWLKAHDIKGEGTRTGQDNLPTEDSTISDDETHMQILAWVNKRAADCKEDVTKYLQDKLASLNDLSQNWVDGTAVIDLDSVVDKYCHDIENDTAKSVGDLSIERSEYMEASEDLKQFKNENNLKRVATYPESKFIHWLWVFAAAIGESFLSANLLGNAMAGGTIEGWLVAILLTGGNILFGIVAGTCLRYSHKLQISIRVLSVSLLICMTIFAIWWNVIAGHARDVIALAGTTGNLDLVARAFVTASENLLEKPDSFKHAVCYARISWNRSLPHINLQNVQE